MSHENPITLVSTRDLDVTVLESGSEKQETMPAGTSFVITATDGESFAETKLKDGRICRIPVTKDADGWEWKSTVSARMIVLSSFIMPDRQHDMRKQRKGLIFYEATRGFSYTHNLL